MATEAINVGVEKEVLTGQLEAGLALVDLEVVHQVLASGRATGRLGLRRGSSARTGPSGSGLRWSVSGYK